MGQNDVSSLADLDSAYQVVQSMRIVPVTWQPSLLLAIVTLIPILPLLLTMMPLEELINKLFSILF
jgi:hypothetical protein